MATLERPIIWNYIFCSEAVIVIVLYGRSCSLQLIGPRKFDKHQQFLSLACLSACLLACMSACMLLLAMHQRQIGSHPWRLQKHQRQRETCLCSSSTLLQTRKTFASASSRASKEQGMSVCYLRLEGCWGTEAVVEIYISNAKWPALVFKRAI